MSKIPDTKPPAAKTDDKPGSKSGGKSGTDMAKAAAKAETQADAKPDAKVTAKPDTQFAAKPEGAPATSSRKSGDAPKGGTKPAAAKPKTGGSGFLRGALVAAVVIVVAVVAAVATSRDWWPVVEPYVGEWVEPYLPADEEADDAAVRIADLEARIDAMESAAAGMASADALADLEAARAALSAQIDRIMTRLDETEAALTSLRSLAASRTSSSGGEALSDDVLQRIEDLETAVQSANRDQVDLNQQIEALLASRSETMAVNSRSQALALAAGQLRVAISGGRPFVDPLSVLAAAGDGDETVTAIVAALEPHAARGVATLDELRRVLAADAGAIASAGAALEGEDWTSQAINSIQSLVTVRRLDGGDVTTVDGRLARAEELLAAGDLIGAYDTLDGLEGRARDAAAPWLERAAARLEADAALADLQAHAIRLLTQAGG